jgi:hypothetical protein
MILERLDWLLHPTRLQGSTEQLRQGRLAAGTAVLFTFSDAANALLELRQGAASSLILLSVAGAFCALLAVVWLRFRCGSLAVPALLVTVPILVAVGFVALHHNLAVVGNSPWAIAAARRRCW